MATATQDGKCPCRHRTRTGILSFATCKRAASKDGYCTRHHPDYVSPIEKRAIDRSERKNRRMRAARIAYNDMLGRLVRGEVPVGTWKKGVGWYFSPSPGKIRPSDVSTFRGQSDGCTPRSSRRKAGARNCVSARPGEKARRGSQTRRARAELCNMENPKMTNTMQRKTWRYTSGLWTRSDGAKAIRCAAGRRKGIWKALRADGTAILVEREMIPADLRKPWQGYRYARGAMAALDELFPLSRGNPG
jgi:hypothetical protein